MFPGPGAVIYRNKAGEPTGWDYPSSDPADYYCDGCGFSHAGPCPIEDEDGPFDGCCDLGDADGPRYGRPDEPWRCSHCGGDVPDPEHFDRAAWREEVRPR
jgi:hypothetical protein